MHYQGEFTCKKDITLAIRQCKMLYSKNKHFLARLHFSAEELSLYSRRRRQRPRPHTKC